MHETINEQLKNHFYHSPEIEPEIACKEQQVLNSEISSFMAAKQLLDKYFRSEMFSD
jgi:LAO/AO transport system kinase